jgi:hypothetical protein
MTPSKRQRRSGGQVQLVDTLYGCVCGHSWWSMRNPRRCPRCRRMRQTKLQKAVLQAVQVESDWWHKEWHNATGIPCDGVSEYCPLVRRERSAKHG